MIKSLFENDTLSGKMSLINNNIFVEGFFFFKRAIEANVPKNQYNINEQQMSNIRRIFIPMFIPFD